MSEKQRIDEILTAAIKANAMTPMEACALKACVLHIYKSGCLVSNQPFTLEYGLMTSNNVGSLLE